MKDLLTILEERSYRIPFSGCQVWLGALDGAGYGVLRIGGDRGGRAEKVHRISFSLLREQIPEGLLVCHHCDVRSCFNPEHLFLGTQKDNSQDASIKGRLHVKICKNGHPATPDNRYVYPNNKGSYCKVCKRKNQPEEM